LAIMIVVGSWAFYNAKSDLRAGLVENIQKQVSLVESLAIQTDGNGADAVVASIITDCPNREKFETLLSRLGTLNRQDLLIAQQLFESCGGFYSERKSVMVSRLVREYEILEDYHQLLLSLDGENTSNIEIEGWGKLVDLEVERSDLLAEQVVLQEDIISLLITGSSILSTEVSALAGRAQNVAELLSVIGAKIDVIRENLIS